MNRARSIRQSIPVAVATAGAAVFLASSPAALAATEDWNSRSDPLVAWESGDQQALAYGTAYTKEGSLKNHTWYRDPRPGGDKVYTETEYNVYYYTYQGSQWMGRCCQDQSVRKNDEFWHDQYDAWYYADVPDVDKGRVYYKVCEDQDWSPDACSANPFITFSL